jgi:multiple sugar transport system ATP-binding protein
MKADRPVNSIVLESVRKEFPGGVVAVRDFSLEVDPGEFIVLVGPSGCGKTTTLRMVAGLEEVTGGEVRINGRVVTRLPPRQRDIAMVFQNYALYAHMNVRGNMGFGLKMSGVPKNQIRDRVEATARMLGIVDLLDRKPKQLSGGERQRVAMGRAIVREPAAFLMDEPLSNLDAKRRVEMRGEIINLQRRLGTPTLYVTHDQVEAMTMGHRVAILRLGQLQQLGSPEEVYENPANLFVATFMGSPAMNVLPGRLESKDGHCVVSLGDWCLPVPPSVLRRRPRLAEYGGREVILGVRPEDFRAANHGPGGDEGLVGVTISRAESLGSELVVYFRLNGVSEPGEREPAPEQEAIAEIRDQVSIVTAGMLTARLSRNALPREAGRAELAMDLERLYFFDPQTGTAITR